MKVICLCGSTRFRSAFELANMDETMRGNVVISVGLFGHADHPEGARFLTSDGDESTTAKQDLDALHLRKIDLADEVLVVNVGGYVGSSTTREIAYAQEQGKTVRFLFSPHQAPSHTSHDPRALAQAAPSGVGQAQPLAGIVTSRDGAGIVGSTTERQ